MHEEALDLSRMNTKFHFSIIALVVLVPALALFVYQTQSNKVEHDAFNNLQSIVKLKSEELQNYLRERRGDCEIFRQSENIRARVEQFIDEPDIREHSAILQSRLDLMRSVYGYEGAILVNSTMKVVLALVINPPKTACGTW